MKIGSAVFALAALFLLSSCFPVWKTEENREWDGPQRADGTHVAIKARYNQKYLRILLTPEGPKDSPRGKATYRYFIGRTTGERGPWSDLVELPWLAIEAQQIDSWGDVTALNETPYWYAIRYLDDAAPWHNYEIMVFSRTGVKHRRRITGKDFPRFLSDNPPPENNQPRPVTVTVAEITQDPKTGWQLKIDGKIVTAATPDTWNREPRIDDHQSDGRFIGWRETPRRLEVEYESPTGRRRYQVLNDVDQPIGADGKVVSDVSDSPGHVVVPVGGK